MMSWERLFQELEIALALEIALSQLVTLYNCALALEIALAYII